MTRGFGTAQEATWRFAYDPSTMGVISVTDPDGHTDTNTYDANGNRVSHIDALGRRSDYSYDAFNQLATATDPLRVTTTYNHDPTNGNLTSVSRPLVGTTQVATTTYTYDPATYTSPPGIRAGDVINVTDANLKNWTFTYDSAGDRASMTDPLQHQTRYCYDPIGRLTEMVRPFGSGGFVCPASPPTSPPPFATLYTFNAFGDVTSVTDPQNHTTIYVLDANRNLA